MPYPLATRSPSSREAARRPRQIVNFSGGEYDPEGMTQSVHQRMDVCAQFPFASADRLIFARFFCAGTVLVGSHDGAVDHRVFIVGVFGQKARTNETP